MFPSPNNADSKNFEISNLAPTDPLQRTVFETIFWVNQSQALHHHTLMIFGSSNSISHSKSNQKILTVFVPIHFYFV